MMIRKLTNLSKTNIGVAGLAVLASCAPKNIDAVATLITDLEDKDVAWSEVLDKLRTMMVSPGAIPQTEHGRRVAGMSGSANERLQKKQGKNKSASRKKRGQ